jgi:hypothetical protein
VSGFAATQADARLGTALALGRRPLGVPMALAGGGWERGAQRGILDGRGQPWLKTSN